jgi:hypothetical protein
MARRKKNLLKYAKLESVSLNRSRQRFLILSMREETRLLLALDIVTSKISFTPLSGMKQLRIILPPSTNLIYQMFWTYQALQPYQTSCFPKYMSL